MTKWKLPFKIEEFIVWCFVAIYTITASIVSLHRFWQYDAFWYDFGVLDETIWKWSRFSLPFIPSLKPPDGIMVWGDHFNPSAILLAPVYWISSRPEMTLILQAIFVGLSALVFYQILKKVIDNSVVRISLIFSYLGFVGMQNALYTDIHNIVYALLPLSLTFWAIYLKKWRWYWFFLLITIGFQENMAGVAVGIGLFLIIRKDRNIKVGLVTMIFAAIYAILATKFIMPYFAGQSYKYSPYIPQHLTGWVTQIFLPIDPKSRTIFMTLATFGFMPVLSISALPLILEQYVERFVLNIVGTRWDLGFHYNSIMSAFMLIASIESILWIQKSFLKRFLTLWAIGTILTVIFLHRFLLHGPFLLATHPVFYDQTVRAKFNDSFLQRVPRDGLIMAQNNLLAHLTHDNSTLLDLRYELIEPKWIVVDTRPGQNPNNFHPLRPEEFDFFVETVSGDLMYKKYYVNGGQMIFKRQNCSDFIGFQKADIPPKCLLNRDN